MEDGKTNSTVCVTPTYNAGYNANLFLGDFTKDTASDILVRIESGGSGGYLFAYVYSLKDNKLVKVFDFDKFNAKSQFNVAFKDNYKVEVIQVNTNKTFSIDLSNRKDQYSDIYDKNGKLIKPVTGNVLGLGGLEPVDVDNDGNYELIAIQRIIGRFNADTLGYIKTLLIWNGSSFVPAEININSIPKNNSCGIIKFDNTQELDFSFVKYMVSETERDEKLEEALAQVYGLKPGEHEIRYFYNRIDLNGDNIPETFVYLVGQSICGTGGCSAVIFKIENNRYKLLSEFTLVNNPVIVSNDKTNGYNNLIMYVAGGGIKSFFAEIKYNGTEYPTNPSLQPQVTPGTKVRGNAIIADDIANCPGIKF